MAKYYDWNGGKYQSHQPQNSTSFLRIRAAIELHEQVFKVRPSIIFLGAGTWVLMANQHPEVGSQTSVNIEMQDGSPTLQLHKCYDLPNLSILTAPKPKKPFFSKAYLDNNSIETNIN